MKKTSFYSILLILVLLFSGCSSANSETAPKTDTATEENNKTSGESGSTQNSEAPSDETDAAATDTAATIQIDTSEMFSDRDFEVGYDESESAIITLNGTSASCNSNAVQISGSTVTITDEGTYILSGTLNDGMIIVNTEKTDKTQLVLNGVTIHSQTCAPVYILQSDKVFITTAAGTTNTLSNGGTFTAIDENNIDSVIFSKEDVTLNGSGTLVITSPAGHGIVSKDSLTLTSGMYDINCASHGLSGKDDVCIANAEFTIVSGKDGIHAENADDEASGFVYIQSGTFDITAEGDGISAAAYMQIEDGSFRITSGGGSENAASQSSQDWGNFMGGGRHPGGVPGDKGSGRGGYGGPGGADVPGGTGGPGGADVPGGTGGPGGSGAPTDSRGGKTGRQGGSGGDASTLSMNMSAATDTISLADESTSIKGIKAGTALIINGGTFTIDSADDSFHSNGSVTINGGTFEIASGDDAFHADDTLTITEGTANITESYEGLEGLHILVSGGEIALVSSDDGLNAAGGTDFSGMGGRDAMGMGGPGSPFSSSDGSIVVSGGTLHITASGDGIDANGTLEITGGFTTVCGPTQGDTATLDYDLSAVISGGTFIGTGGADMAQTFSDSEQGVVAVSVGNQSAGTAITLTNSDGKEILSHEPELSFAVVILSSPDIVKGETYTITVGELSGEFEAS